MCLLQELTILGEYYMHGYLTLEDYNMMVDLAIQSYLEEVN